jgi:hypothetical protein
VDEWELPPSATVNPVFGLYLQESELRASVHSSLYLTCIYNSCIGNFRLFENGLKYVSFPMIEETLFREGEAVF